MLQKIKQMKLLETAQNLSLIFVFIKAKACLLEFHTSYQTSELRRLTTPNSCLISTFT